MNYRFINGRKKELGYTNAELSKLTGITISTLDKITAGANQNPKLETMQALARVLRCSLDDFNDDRQETPDFTPSDFELAYLKRYRELDAIGQEAVRAVIDCEHKRTSTAGPRDIVPRAGKDIRAEYTEDEIARFGFAAAHDIDGKSRYRSVTEDDDNFDAP